MHPFQDNQQRDWLLAITVGHQIKLKSLHGIDIRHVSIFDKLLDPEAFANILGCLLGAQLKERELTLEDVLSDLGPDQLDNVIEQLIEEIIDFFPRSQRQVLRTLLAKSQESRTELAKTTQTQAASQEMSQLIQNATKVASLNMTTAIAGANAEMERQLSGASISNASGRLQEQPA